jgi:hypothetical protein
MLPDALLKYWDTTYPGVPIVPHRLRIAYGDRWLRIHSLPRGKRYAASQGEYVEILRRQNTVIDDLIGAGRRYELVFGYFGEERDLPRPVTTTLNGLDPVPLTTLSPEQSDKEKAFPLFVASLTWTTSQLDVVLRAVADDVLETPLLVGVEQGCVIAPYDGGMDIFVADESERDELREHYAGWLPARSSGL